MTMAKKIPMKPMKMMLKATPKPVPAPKPNPAADNKKAVAILRPKNSDQA